LPSIYAESRRHLPTPQMSIDYVGEISIGLCVLLLILYAAVTARIAQRARARTLQATAAAPNPPEPSGAAMSTGLAIALLAISSLLVALLSDFLDDSVDVVKQSLGWTDLSDGSDRNRCGHERGAWGLYRAAGADIAWREEVRGSLWRLSFGDASNLGSAARWFRLVSSGCPTERS
jgi:hypothetical protein